jgi:hypothetical protein
MMELAKETACGAIFVAILVVILVGPHRCRSPIFVIIIVPIIVDKDRDNDRDNDPFDNDCDNDCDNDLNPDPFSPPLACGAARTPLPGVALSVYEYGRRVRSTMMHEAIR